MLLLEPKNYIYARDKRAFILFFLSSFLGLSQFLGPGAAVSLESTGQNSESLGLDVGLESWWTSGRFGQLDRPLGR